MITIAGWSERERCAPCVYSVCVCVCDRFTVWMKLFSAAGLNKNVCLGVWMDSFVKKCVKRECMIKWMYIWICLIVQLFTTVPLLSKFVKYIRFCLKMTTEFVYIIKLKKACTHYVAKMSLFPINSTESAKWHLSHRSVRQLYLQVDEILRMKSEYDLIGVMDTKSTHTQVYCFKWKLVKHAVLF